MEPAQLEDQVAKALPGVGFRDGAVDYEGIRFVKTKGPAQGKLAPAQLAALDQLFQSNHYLGLHDAYEEYKVTDMPSIYTSYAPAGGKAKTVRHYVGDRSAPALHLLPTFVDLLGTPPADGFSGRSLAPILMDPAAGVQDDVVFTFDDTRAGNPNGTVVRAADRIRCIRETKWKYARYFHQSSSYPEEWEMYDLENDPSEIDNLGSPANPRYNDPGIRAERERLQKKLMEAETRIVIKNQNVDQQKIAPLGD